MTAATDPHFEALLEYLLQTRGFDLSAYKRASLMRRVQKRMHTINQADFEAYRDYLEVHPEEFVELFNTILINVTSFFRDREAWDLLAADVVPRLLAAKDPADPFRVWCAGCASGEETYSLAMVLAEALGAEAFQQRVKIYASDVDQHALAEARTASYSASQLEAVPAPLRDKYFTAAAGQFVFRSDLRRVIIYGRHDLVQDAPISRLDLLSCRNTLMYFNAETQGRILARFHFALNETGFLFLGKAEMLITHSSLFMPVDLHSRIFTRVPRAHGRERLLLMAQAGDPEAVGNLGRHIRLREGAFNASPVPQLAVDLGGTVVLMNERLRSLFGLDVKDVGRPLQDLEISYRPADLRSLLDQARTERRTITASRVERRLPSGDVQFFDITVAPLLHNGASPLGMTIAFEDVTHAVQLQTDLQRVNQEMETTNEELQSAHEELETTNEELQSTNEELETTNEELQSTNEELETMNEELQSTNEELETINNELRGRTTDLDRVNLFLQSILAAVPLGVVVVDRERRVQIWNTRAEDLWGLRADEVQGKSLLALDIGLAVKHLDGSIRAALTQGNGKQEVALDAMNRRGRSIRCFVTIMPLGLDGTADIPGALLLMGDLESMQATLAARTVD